MSRRVRVRFAPSPTGLLHLGGLRTALYDYVFARQQKGDFILRIEDTDQNRYVPGAVENLIHSLRIMGLDYDEGPDKDGGYGPYFQSQRLSIYKEHVDRLIELGAAYPCFCSQERIDEIRRVQAEQKEPIKYDGQCRSLAPSEARRRIDSGEKHVIRLRMPDDGSFLVSDLIRGEVEISATQIDDQVLVKSDGFPTYHLAATIDDHLMEISHVLRGEEWLSSAPKHVHLYNVLGWEQPKWVHLPLLLNKDKSKLSKRHGDFSVEHFLQQGYVREALVNFVALLGWHPAADDELFPLDRMIAEFSFERVNKAGAVFDMDKLNWMNGWYIRNIPVEDVMSRAGSIYRERGFDISDNGKYSRAVNTARNYVTLLNELPDQSAIYYEPIVYTDADRDTLANEKARRVLEYWKDALIPGETWDKETLEALVQKGIADTGIKGKDYYFPLRLALIGRTHGPDIPTLVHILGTDESLLRLGNAVVFAG